MQAPTLIAGLLETLLVQLLKYHPEPRPLAKWQGQVISFQFRELNFPLFMVLTDPMQIYSQYDGQPDASIKLSLQTLTQFNDGSNLSTLVNQGELEIEGDMQLVGKLLSLLSAIEPDFAEPLSKIVGDAMAYRIEQGTKTLLNTAKRDFTRLKRHSREFVKEELRLVPIKAELDWFRDEVSNLTKRAEKLEQRLAKRNAIT